MPMDYYAASYVNDTERLKTARLALDDLALKAIHGERAVLISTLQVMMTAAYEQGRDDQRKIAMADKLRCEDRHLTQDN